MSILQSRLLLLLGVILVLGTVNFSIWKKQKIVSAGDVILLKLAPVDPRSLMQGDYMILRYALADQLTEQLNQSLDPIPPRGKLLIERDSQQVVTRIQLYHSQPLQAGQALLNYRYKNGQIWLGAESFFFQEGHAAAYQVAEYAELRLNDTGQAVLIRLYDAQRQPIRPTPPKTPTSTL